MNTSNIGVDPVLEIVILYSAGGIGPILHIEEQSYAYERSVSASGRYFTCSDPWRSIWNSSSGVTEIWIKDVFSEKKYQYPIIGMNKVQQRKNNTKSRVRSIKCWEKVKNDYIERNIICNLSFFSSMELLNQYLSSFKNQNSTIPLIISRDRIYEILESFTGIMPESLEQIQTGEFPQVFFYGIAEEKKHFDIATVRKCIQDMSLKPYEGKNLYILMDVDTASLEAQNALLKILEECPEYAIIILAVTHPEWLIETIHSRCLLIQENTYTEPLSEEVKKMIHDYHVGNSLPFVSYLYSASYSREEAIRILRYGIQFSKEHMCQDYEDAIIEMIRGVETPKYILDTIYIIPHGV
jgi:hypothetical protein